MKKLTLILGLLGAVCANAYIDEYGQYIPEYVETDDGGCYLYFDRAVICQGLIEKVDAATGHNYYTGMCTLKVAKGSKAKPETKWTQDVILEGGTKLKFSGKSSLCDEYEPISVKGHTCSVPWIDWTPVCFGSDIDDGSAFGWMVDTKRKELKSLNKTSVSLRIYAESAAQGTIPATVAESLGQLTLSFANGGNVKIAGTLPDGTKVSSKATLTGVYSESDGNNTYVGGTLPIYIPNKNKRGGLGIDLELYAENGFWHVGEYSAIWHNAGGANNIVYCELEEFSVGANGTYEFDFGEVVEVAQMYAESLMTENERSWTEAYVLEDFAYCGLVDFQGKKVSVPKSGSVKLQKFKEEDDVWYEPVCSNCDNPIALKLKYNAKSGAITGSVAIPVVVDKWTIKTRRIDGDVDEYETVSSSIKKFSVKFSGFAEDGEIYLFGKTKYGDFGVYGYRLEAYSL